MLGDRSFLPRFLQLLNAKTWPDLHSLTIWEHEIPQDDLSVILTSMTRVTSLDINCSSDTASLKMMEMLGPHFSGLTVLRLRSANQRPTCLMAQEILSSCPLLESFRTSLIDATIVAEGKPWVCLGLKELDLGFFFQAIDNPTRPASGGLINCQGSGISRRCVYGQLQDRTIRFQHDFRRQWISDLRMDWASCRPFEDFSAWTLDSQSEGWRLRRLTRHYIEEPGMDL